MQDADSQLVKLILTLEMLISVKYFSILKCLSKYIFGLLCPYPMRAFMRSRGERPDPSNHTTYKKISKLGGISPKLGGVTSFLVEVGYDTLNQKYFSLLLKFLSLKTCFWHQYA